MKEQRILGIDPGLNSTGYGIIRISESHNPKLVTYGHIRTSSKKSLAERLYLIYQKLDELVQQHLPQSLAIEDIFYAENVKTAIVMGHARAAAMLAGMVNQIPVAEYSPREVKMSVVGNGAAVKGQVKFMVQRLLQVKEDIQPNDASDALAVALCHWHRKDKKQRGLG